ncbi:MAG: hypothetical protein IPK82_06925 [Polyangiaceae bacterium]|nr:hypothetical protein [Polyangiaceae bacterium]
MINDTPQNAGEYALARFYSDTDRDLSAFAFRYGTRFDDLITFDGDHNPHWHNNPRVTRGEIQQYIEGGSLFALEIPADEARMAWGLYENQTGRDVTLQDVVNEINNRATAIPQPRVDADLLWSYAMNAEMRAEALHNRSEGERHSFETDPNRAPVHNRGRVFFPVVRSTTARAVCVSPGCSTPLSPRPAWVPAYLSAVRNIERLAHRLDLVRRHIERLHLEGGRRVAVIDFTLELMSRLMLEQNPPSQSLRDAYNAINALRRSAQDHLVTPSVQTIRPMWFRELDRVSRELSAALSNRQFLLWQDIMWNDHANFDRAAVTSGVDMILAQAVDALGLAGTDYSRQFFERSQRLVDGQTPPEDQDSVVVLYLRKFFGAALLAAQVGPIAISNTPGPPSIAGMIFAYQIFYGLAGQAVAREVGVRRLAKFRDFFALRLGPTDLLAFDRALAANPPPLTGTAPRTGTAAAQQAETQVVQNNRATGMMRALRSGLGERANQFALACSLLGLASTVYSYATQEGDTTNWQRVGFGLSLTSGAVTTFFAATSVSTRAMNLAEGMVQAWVPYARSGQATMGIRVGALAGRVTGILSVMQGIYQVADYAATEGQDRRVSNAIAGVLTLTGGLITIAGTFAVIPGLQAAGIIIALGAIVASAWPHDGDNFKAVIAALVDSVKSSGIDDDEADRQYYDSFMGGGFGGQSFYDLVVGEDTEQHPSNHALAQAFRRAKTAINNWPGHALRDNSDNRQYLNAHHFSQAQIEAIVD